MKKRSLFTAAVSALVVSTMVAAPIVASAATGTATVGFTATDPQIDVPPTTGDLTGFTDLNLDFGSQAIDSASQNYLSTASADLTKQYAGLVITNNSGGTKGYNVTAQLADFKEADNVTIALLGTTLTLNTATDGTYPKPNVATQPATDAPTMLAAQTLTPGGASAQMASAAIGKGKGAWGLKWSGNLAVPGGSATPGAKTAVMTWNINVVPVTP